MPSKILAKIFWIFAFFCFLLIVQVDREQTSKKKPNTPKELQREQIKKEEFPQFYLSYLDVLNATSPEEKLKAIEYALKIANQENYSKKSMLQNLHLLAADIHHSRWHVVYALEHYTQAQGHIFTQRVEDQINQLKKHLKQYEKERGLFQEYVATKYSGPAKTLTGKVLVAYVFIDEGLKTRWSNKTKLRTQQTLSLVQQWQQQKAKEYGVDSISFINKTFVARRNPTLKQPNKVSFTSSGQEIEKYVTMVANSLGENSIGEFIEKQVKLNGADQGVVILHSNFDQRSFAHRCGYTHKQKVFKNGRYQTKFLSQCKNEYVMLMEQVKRNRWDKMHYAQAHEIMHVFGAADLYNIEAASNYAVTDIMNYQSKNLIHSQVEPITAYAIGWLDEKPQAPFKVLER